MSVVTISLSEHNFLDILFYHYNNKPRLLAGLVSYKGKNMKAFFKINYITIGVTILLLLGIVSYEMGTRQSNKVYEINKGTVFQLSKSVYLKSGRCTWNKKGDSLYGIYYSSRHLLPSYVSSKTNWEVLWITNKSVILPGLTRTTKGIDTTILCQNPERDEMYIVATHGKDLEIAYKDREVCYEGKAEKISLEDLNKILKVIQP